MEYIEEEKRIKVIEEILKEGKLYQSIAESSSVSAIRKPKDKDALDTAQRYVLMNDERKLMADKLIQIVNAYWPREKT